VLDQGGELGRKIVLHVASAEVVAVVGIVVAIVEHDHARQPLARHARRERMNLTSSSEL
jgi:hypothetical protein